MVLETSRPSLPAKYSAKSSHFGGLSFMVGERRRGTKPASALRCSLRYRISGLSSGGL